MNLSAYMMLRAEQPDNPAIATHPVMQRLQQLNKLNVTLEEKVETDSLREQFRNLAKASKLMATGEISEDEDSEEEEEDEQSDEAEHSDEVGMQVDSAEEGSSDDDDESTKVDEKELQRQVMNEARFGLRQDDLAPSATRRRRRMVDTGDGDGDDLNLDATRALASTINTLEQKSRKRRNAPGIEQLEEPVERDGELKRGLEMMEAELGRLSDDDKGGDNDDESMDPELADDDDEDAFYAAIRDKSKAKKASKKSKYAVAPKFPSVENEIVGERAINRTILKNRGLVAHKAKINRNPRVKKREQYRKALIRRKGAVREVRTDEGHKYGGESTGINRGISRSRKLG